MATPPAQGALHGAARACKLFHVPSSQKTQSPSTEFPLGLRVPPSSVRNTISFCVLVAVLLGWLLAARMPLATASTTGAVAHAVGPTATPTPVPAGQPEEQVCISDPATGVCIVSA